MFEQKLQDLGLSEKEAKVYLAALELGAETAQNISTKAAVNRATTYVQIEALKAKGLMSEFDKGKKTYYVAESPDRLTSLFKTLEADVELKKAELHRVLPALTDLFMGMGERPKVRFFEGQEGMRLMREDFAKIQNKQIYSIINIDKVLEYSPQIENEYLRDRVARKISIDVIYTSKKGPTEFLKDDEFRKAKFMPLGELPIEADITIYDHKVVIEGYKTSKLIGIVIDSQEIATTMRTIFSNLWDRL